MDSKYFKHGVSINEDDQLILSSFNLKPFHASTSTSQPAKLKPENEGIDIAKVLLRHGKQAHSRPQPNGAFELERKLNLNVVTKPLSKKLLTIQQQADDIQHPQTPTRRIFPVKYAIPEAKRDSDLKAPLLQKQSSLGKAPRVTYLNDTGSLDGILPTKGLLSSQLSNFVMTRQRSKASDSSNSKSSMRLRALKNKQFLNPIIRARLKHQASPVVKQPKEDKLSSTMFMEDFDNTLLDFQDTRNTEDGEESKSVAPSNHEIISQVGVRYFRKVEPLAQVIANRQTHTVRSEQQLRPKNAASTFSSQKIQFVSRQEDYPSILKEPVRSVELGSDSQILSKYTSTPIDLKTSHLFKVKPRQLYTTQQQTSWYNFSNQLSLKNAMAMTNYMNVQDQEVKESKKQLLEQSKIVDEQASTLYPPTADPFESTMFTNKMLSQEQRLKRIPQKPSPFQILMEEQTQTKKNVKEKSKAPQFEGTKETLLVTQMTNIRPDSPVPIPPELEHKQQIFVLKQTNLKDIKKKISKKSKGEKPEKKRLNSSSKNNFFSDFSLPQSELLAVTSEKVNIEGDSKAGSKMNLPISTSKMSFLIKKQRSEQKGLPLSKIKNLQDGATRVLSSRKDKESNEGFNTKRGLTDETGDKPSPYQQSAAGEDDGRDSSRLTIHQRKLLAINQKISTNTLEKSDLEGWAESFLTKQTQQSPKDKARTNFSTLPDKHSKDPQPWRSQDLTQPKGSARQDNDTINQVTTSDEGEGAQPSFLEGKRMHQINEDSHSEDRKTSSFNKLLEEIQQADVMLSTSQRTSPEQKKAVADLEAKMRDMYLKIIDDCKFKNQYRDILVPNNRGTYSNVRKYVRSQSRHGSQDSSSSKIQLSSKHDSKIKRLQETAKAINSKHEPKVSKKIAKGPRRLLLDFDEDVQSQYYEYLVKLNKTNASPDFQSIIKQVQDRKRTASQQHVRSKATSKPSSLNLKFSKKKRAPSRYAIKKNELRESAKCYESEPEGVTDRSKPETETRFLESTQIKLSDRFDQPPQTKRLRHPSTESQMKQWTNQEIPEQDSTQGGMDTELKLALTVPTDSQQTKRRTHLSQLSLTRPATKASNQPPSTLEPEPDQTTADFPSIQRSLEVSGKKVKVFYVKKPKQQQHTPKTPVVDVKLPQKEKTSPVAVKKETIEGESSIHLGAVSPILPKQPLPFVNSIVKPAMLISEQRRVSEVSRAKSKSIIQAQTKDLPEQIDQGVGADRQENLTLRTIMVSQESSLEMNTDGGGESVHKIALPRPKIIGKDGYLHITEYRSIEDYSQSEFFLSKQALSSPKNLQ